MNILKKTSIGFKVKHLSHCGLKSLYTVFLKKKFLFWNFPQWRGTVSKQKIEINTLGSKRAAVPKFKSKISLLFFLETFLKVH